MQLLLLLFANPPEKPTLAFQLLHYRLVRLYDFCMFASHCLQFVRVEVLIRKTVRGGERRNSTQMFFEVVLFGELGANGRGMSLMHNNSC